MSAREILQNWDSYTELPERKEIYENILACDHAEGFLRLLKEYRDAARSRAQASTTEREEVHFLGASRMIDDLIADMTESVVSDQE